MTCVIPIAIFTHNDNYIDDNNNDAKYKNLLYRLKAGTKLDPPPAG